MQGVIDSFRSHLDALYVLALLCTGERGPAEAAVVAAMVAAADDPSMVDADRPVVWQRLASHCTRPHTVAAGSSAATGRTADLSGMQLQTMALIASGHDVEYVATLLDIRPSQVRAEFRTGTAVLHRSFGP